MYIEEQRSVEAVLRAVLRSERESLELRLVEQYEKYGYPALSVGKGPRPDAPSVVVFDDPGYAVIYLFADEHMNEAEFEVFRKEAQEFAWAHGAAAYFVRIGEVPVSPGTG